MLCSQAELDRGGLIHRDVHTVHAATLGEAIEYLDITRPVSPEIQEFYRAAPAGVRTVVPFSQKSRYPSLDVNRESGAVRDVAHAFSVDGGWPCCTALSPKKDAFEDRRRGQGSPGFYRLTENSAGDGKRWSHEAMRRGGH